MQAPGDEALEAVEHARARASSGIAQPASCAIASTYAVSTSLPASPLGREVAQQAVAVEVGGQAAPSRAFQQRVVAQRDGPRDALLEAGVRIRGHVLAHAVAGRRRASRAVRTSMPPRPGIAPRGRSTACDDRRRRAAPASPGRCAPGTARRRVCDVRTRVARRAVDLDGLDRPGKRVDADRRRHRPGEIARAAGRHVDRQRRQIGAGRRLAPSRFCAGSTGSTPIFAAARTSSALRRVAHRERRRRSGRPRARAAAGRRAASGPASCGCSRGRCRSTRRRRRDGDDAEARQRVVERHLDACASRRRRAARGRATAAACRRARARRRGRRRRPWARPCGRSGACRRPASARSRSAPRAAARPSSRRAGSRSRSARARAGPRRPRRARSRRPPAGAAPSARAHLRRRRAPSRARDSVVARRRDLDGAAAVRPADPDLRDAEPIGGLAEIDERGGRAALEAPWQAELARQVREPGSPARHAAAHREHRDEDVRRVAVARSALRSPACARESRVTKLSSTPSRSTVTSAVALRNGMRTWKRAVSPGSYSFCSGSRSMRSALPGANHQSSSPATQTVVRRDGGVAAVVLGAGAQDDFARDPGRDLAAQESLARRCGPRRRPADAATSTLFS